MERFGGPVIGWVSDDDDDDEEQEMEWMQTTVHRVMRRRA